MSKTVDERVVEMRFDNGQFERNVQTSMSTLEKLKRSLNLTGAAKGLDNVNSAAKNVNMAGLGSSVDTVTAKFSALQVMGVTALVNITNSAVNAGKRMISALTIDPIKSGFQEYETQINAVQTILANTQKEGATIENVNAALDELNTYADKTIYNFTEMTRNIGTFTAAGVDLETSVNAIQGIANLAAVSGSTSQQASTAMYQLSQALAAGTVKLMDWNSVVNAGMGGQVFQDALRETSELLGTGAEAAIAAQGSFRESLQTGWLTSEVLTETLKKFTTSGANEYVAEYTGLSKEAVEAALEEAEARYGEADAIEYASKALAEKSGKNAEEIKQALQFAKTAEDAATKVKTFTQLWDVLKEAAQSGWAQTWRIIIGDFEEAKEFFTPVADALTTIIGKFSDARNALLESALGKSFSALGDKLSGLLEPAGKAVEVVENATSSLVDLGKIVDDVILGKFGNGKERFDALTEAGVNWYEVQNKVNETLGDSTRYSKEQIDAQNKLLGTQKQTTDSTSEAATETAKLTDEQKKQIKELAALSDEQLRQKGYTEEQIKTFQELRNTAEKLGIPLNDFIDNLDKINGRWLLLESVKNIGRAIASVFSSIGKAWKEVMDPINPDTVFNIIAAFHKFTASLILNEERANNLKRTFKGLFAILHMVTTILGGGFKLAFRVLSEILSRFNLDIFEFTAIIGDAFVAIDKFLFKNEIVSTVFDLLADAIKGVIKAIEKLVKAFKKLPQVQKFIKNVKDAIGDIKNIELSDVGANIIAGLRNGLSGGISDVISSIGNIAKTIITTFCSILGIHSPSTVSFEWGKNIIEGLVNGISFAIGKVVDVVQKIGNTIINAFKGIDLEGKLDPIKNAFTKFYDFVTSIDYTKLLAVIPIGVVLVMVKKLYDLASSLAEGIDSVNEVIFGFANIENNFAKVLKSFSTKLNAQALKEVAIAIAILTGAIIALTFVDQDKLYGSVVIIGILSGILFALSFAMKKLGEASVSVGKNGLNVDGLKTGLLSIASALLILAVTVKIMGSMDADQAKRGFMGLAGIVVAVGAVFAAYGLLVKGKSAQNIDKAGTMIMKMSISLLLLVGVVKLLSGVTWPDLGKAVAFVTGFVIFVGALVEVTKLSGKNIDKVGKTVFKISFALLLMVGVCKLVGTLSGDEITGGIVFVGGFLLFIKALMMITKVGKEDQIAKLGGLLMSISISMLLMVGVCKLASLLKPEDILAGVVFVSGFLLFVKALVKITSVSNGQQTAKVAATILAFSVAIGALAAVSILMSMMSLEGLAKGVGAVTILGVVMTGMIAATKGANNVKGNLIVMTVAIAVMAAAVAALSMIDGKKLAGASMALSTVMGMFALMEKAAEDMNSSIGSLLMMTVTVGLLAGIIYLLSGLPIESTLASAASLSMLLLSLSASMFVISKAGTISSEAMISLAGMFAVVSGLAGILAILNHFDIAPSLETALALSTLLLALSAATAILSMAGAAAPAALAGVAALAIVVAGVGAIITALGYLTEKFPQLEEFLNRGLPILEKIGYGLGSFVGNIISGVLDGAMSSISQFGTELSNFMKNIQPFLDGASNIKKESVTGIKTLAEAILILTGANLVDSIASFITGGSSLGTFASQLTAFGKGMKSYSGAVAGINTEAITASAEAAKSLAKVADAIPKEGGLWGLLSGEKDLGSFGSKLVPFGEGMKRYAEKVSGINTEAITASASAAKSLVKVAQAIPLEGGIWGLITGEKNLGLFGLKLVPFGEGMKQYAEKVSGINTEAIIASALAAKSMVNVADAIPLEGGIWGLITGEKDLGSFGKKLVPFGEGMKQYAEKVSGVNTAAITSSVSAAKAMVKVANAIPTDLSSIVSASVMSSFGKKLEAFADAMKSYSEKVAGVNAASISSSASAVRSLVGVIKSTSGINAGGVTSFVTAINTLGKAQVSKFVSAFTSSTGKLKAAGSNMMTAVVSGIRSKQSLLGSTATNIVNVMYKALGSKSALFKGSGVKLMAGFVSGISSAKGRVNSAVASTVSGAASKLRGYYSSFHSAGAYLAAGFANGISSKSYMAAAKAKAMAQAAETAARNALKINSPSKVFIKIGMGVPEGFAKGIDQFGYYVKDSIGVMASDALTNTKKAIARVADVVNSDIDAQPTIRPVLDLSDVESGAETLNSMFDKRIVLGSTAKVNAISSMMNARNQNGAAEELTSAIDKLRRDLKNTGNTYYTIDGITYDDGSNISNAVQDLMRAARVERRI